MQRRKGLENTFAGFQEISLSLTCRGIIFLNKLQIEETTEENSFKIHRTDKGLTYTLTGTVLPKVQSHSHRKKF